MRIIHIISLLTSFLHFTSNLYTHDIAVNKKYTRVNRQNENSKILGDTIYTELFATICEGDTFYFNGNPLTEEGEYTASFITSNGLDSIVTLFLEVNIILEPILTGSLCKGDTFWLYGYPITEPGPYTIFIDTFPCGILIDVDVQYFNVDTSVTIIGNSLQSNEPATFVQWYDCITGLPIPGAIGRIFTPTISGTYKARFTSLDGCDAFTGCRTIIISAIGSPADPVQWQIFPNPVHDLLEIRFDREMNQNFDVEIIDIIGRIQMKQNFSGDSPVQRMDMKILLPGTYLIHLTDINGHSSSKLFSKI